MSTRHPHIPEWIGGKPRLLLVNRKDMVDEASRAAWSRFFADRGHPVQWTNGNMGEGVGRVLEAAAVVGAKLNAKRMERGLRPRPVRAVVIGFPNVGAWRLCGGRVRLLWLAQRWVWERARRRAPRRRHARSASEFTPPTPTPLTLQASRRSSIGCWGGAWPTRRPSQA